MPYAYYARLRPRQKAIYRRSDEIGAIRLREPSALTAPVDALEQALVGAKRPAVETAAARLSAGIALQLGVAAPRVKVLTTRPSNRTGELHGLYEPAEGGNPAVVTVWMRTAAHKRVVAFRTFLRTLLHELCHHFDYHLLKLEDSFHTEGFFKRESSLFNQLVPPRPVAAPPRDRGARISAKQPTTAAAAAVRDRR
jgi:hypothetical protein